MSIFIGFRNRKVRKVLIKQFKENINYIIDRCINECNDISGYVSVSFLKTIIDNCLIPEHKLNPIGIEYNRNMLSMYNALSSIAKKNNKDIASIIDIKSISIMVRIKYKNYIYKIL